MNFRQISQYLGQFLKYKTADHILEILKQGLFDDATQLFGGKIMWIRFLAAVSNFIVTWVFLNVVKP